MIKDTVATYRMLVERLKKIQTNATACRSKWSVGEWYLCYLLRSLRSSSLSTDERGPGWGTPAPTDAARPPVIVVVGDRSKPRSEAPLFPSCAVSACLFARVIIPSWTVVFVLVDHITWKHHMWVLLLHQLSEWSKEANNCDQSPLKCSHVIQQHAASRIDVTCHCLSTNNTDKFVWILIHYAYISIYTFSLRSLIIVDPVTLLLL